MRTGTRRDPDTVKLRYGIASAYIHYVGHFMLKKYHPRLLRLGVGDRGVFSGPIDAPEPTSGRVVVLLRDVNEGCV